ncbi:hypothetical protein PG990_004226 [Apiospora arundinis]
MWRDLARRLSAQSECQGLGGTCPRSRGSGTCDGAADGADAALGVVLELGDLHFDAVELLVDLGVADANDLVNRERLVMGILSRGLLNVGLIINGLHALVVGLFVSRVLILRVLVYGTVFLKILLSGLLVAFLSVLTATGCGGRLKARLLVRAIIDCGSLATKSL